MTKNSSKVNLASFDLNNISHIFDLFEIENMALEDKKTDEMLFADLAKKDNTRALDTLFDRYYEHLCHFSYRFVQDSELAREVVSDVFLKLWKYRKKIELKKSFRVYLYLSVKNQSLDYLKKEKKNIIRSSFEISENQHAATTLSADYSLHQQDIRVFVEHLLATMPPRQSQILRLSKIDGFKNPEIAEILGISEKTVRNQLVEALKFIAKKHPNSKTILSITLILLTLLLCFIIL